MQLRLAIDYAGDAARLTTGSGKLLTDNWFTGYGVAEADGSCSGRGSCVGGGFEVGLSYLAGEELLLPPFGSGIDAAGGAVGTPPNLTLSVLPLRLADLKTQVFVDGSAWPAFNLANGTVALALKRVRVLQVAAATLL